MTERRDLERFGNLFEVITGRNRPFLDQCSDTKLLAISDFPRASDDCRTLVRQVLEGPGSMFTTTGTCRQQVDAVRQSLESGYLGPDLVEALFALRVVFVDNVLRPAVKEFLSADDERVDHVESLYDSAAKLDGLLEIIRFLQKLGNQKQQV